MTETLRLDYYYGYNRLTSGFVQVPKAILVHPQFKNLSHNAKFIYTLLLDKTYLSEKNNWRDSNGKVYVYYGTKTLEAELNLSHGTVTKCMKELEDEYALIERIKRGQGKPDRIYVKVILSDNTEQECIQIENHETPLNNVDYTLTEDNDMSFEDSSYTLTENRCTSDEENTIQKYKICTSENFRSIKNKHQEVQKLDTKKFKNCTSRNSEIEHLEVQKLNCNNININNIDNNNISDHILSIIQQKNDEIGWMDIAQCEHLFKEQIEYASLAEQFRTDTDVLNDICELFLEVMFNRNAVMQFKDATYPTTLVQRRFLSMDRSVVEYVMECCLGHGPKRGNVKNYLLKALFNAPASIGSYYREQVNQDLFTGT